MKSVLISIRQKWCDLIASGRKTIEVRKTRPKIKPPFKCYIYCTVGECFHGIERKNIIDDSGISHIVEIPVWLNKKVIGEFVCDKISMNLKGYKDGIPGYWGLENGSCMSLDELDKYGKNKLLFGWHISNLVIYDEPKWLSEFRHCGENYHYNAPAMSRPPQSWCYVEE